MKYITDVYNYVLTAFAIYIFPSAIYLRLKQFWDYSKSSWYKLRKKPYSANTQSRYLAFEQWSKTLPLNKKKQSVADIIFQENLTRLVLRILIPGLAATIIILIASLLLGSSSIKDNTTPTISAIPLIADGAIVWVCILLP